MVRANCDDERKAGETEEQFLYKTRKKAIGPFKRRLWTLPDENAAEIAANLRAKFGHLFDELGIAGTRDLVERHVTWVAVPRHCRRRSAAPRPLRSRPAQRSSRTTVPASSGRQARPTSFRRTGWSARLIRRRAAAGDKVASDFDCAEGVVRAELGEEAPETVDRLIVDAASAANTPSMARASPRTKISTPRSKRSTNSRRAANRSPSCASSGSLPSRRGRGPPRRSAR